MDAAAILIMDGFLCDMYVYLSFWCRLSTLAEVPERRESFRIETPKRRLLCAPTAARPTKAVTSVRSEATTTTVSVTPGAWSPMRIARPNY